jgi:murein DD-endopeptidase MepM/ murein hydrolase activator NlpD
MLARRRTRHPLTADGTVRKLRGWSPGRYAALGLQILEDRTVPVGNLQITNAFLVDAHHISEVAPVTGQMIYIEADWTTTGLSGGEQYVVRYSVDGVPVDSATITGQAGTNLSYSRYRGGWYAAPGTHTVTATVDGANQVAETNENDNTLTFTFTTVAPTDLPSKFIRPIGGTLNRDYAIGNYADVDPRSGIAADYRGGPFQYDGHDAIDAGVIGTAGFAHMYVGVPIYAAADGTVSAVVDGQYDHQTTQSNLEGNHVWIDHGNNWQTLYYHFAKNSITVKVGDHVRAGQLIGMMGSSGSSTSPHLHFTPYYRGCQVEMGYDTATYETDPIPYAGDVPAFAYDAGVTNYDLAADLGEHPSPATTFTNTQAGGVYSWCWFYDVKPTDTITWNWYRPDGSVAIAKSFSPSSTVRPGIYYFGYGLGNFQSAPGVWQVTQSIDGVEFERTSFTITTGIGVPAVRVTDSGGVIALDERTTPYDFGSAAQGATPPTLTFNLTNHGSAALTTSNLVLPPGVSLAGTFPSSVAAGGSAPFTVQLDTAVVGPKFGAIRFDTNDPLIGTYNFNLTGTVTGSAPVGAPALTLPDPAAAYYFHEQPVIVNPTGTVADWNSANFNGGSLTAEVASGGTVNDRLAIRNRGTGAGQVGVSGSTVTFGGIAIGTFTGGTVVDPLVIALNANATIGATQALLDDITYADVSSTPETAPRYLRFTLVDDTGLVSNMAVKNVTMSPTLFAPTVTSFVVSAPSPTVAGQGFDVTVTALDDSSATFTSYTGTVHFTSSDGQVSAGNGLPADYTFVAADNGVHTFHNVTLKTAGPQSIVVAELSNTPYASAAITVNPAAAAAITAVFGGGQSATVNSPFFALGAKVVDAFDNAVPDVSVTFGSPAAGAGVTFPFGSTSTTDILGFVDAFVAANTLAGTFAVTASVPGVAAPASFTLTNTAAAPAKLIFTSPSAATAVVDTAFVPDLGVRVADTYGNPVPGVTVTFSGPGTGAGATFPGGSTPTTDSAGRVVVLTQANTVAGTYVVNATVAGVPNPASFALTNTPGAAASVTVVSGDNQAVPLNQLFVAPVVRVADAFGNAVPGVQVTFAGPATGAGVTFPAGAQATTDAAGSAGVALSANGLGGTYTVTATAAGVGAPATLTLTNVLPSPVLIGYPQFAAAGPDGTVRFFNPDGSARFSFSPFPGFTGEIRTAAADFTGDGVADLVVGTGPGVATHVAIFDGVDQHELFAVAPFEATFTGGVFVAAGDLTGDGKADLAITPDEGGGPRVRLFDGATFAQLADFYGIDDPKFRGGARAAFGDLNGDGKADLLVAAGFGGGPRLAAYDGAALGSAGGPKLFADFYVFEQTLRNGVFIAAGDVNGDGYADVIAGGGPGGGPRVFALSGKDLVQTGTQTQLANFFAGDANSRGGVRLAVKNFDEDNRADIVTGAGVGDGSRVTGYRGSTILPDGTPSTGFTFDAFPGLIGGVYVG